MTLKPPDGQLHGVWSMHCPPSDPQAFEPLTLSDRFFLDVAKDGAVTGQFGPFPVSGRVDRAGAVSGTGKSGQDVITWKGTITAASKKKSASGSGSFELRAERPCSGTGMWGSE